MLKAEYALLFGFSLFLFAALHYSWWWYALLFLAPDIGMLGYYFGPKVGAITYNTCHSIVLAAVLYALGTMANIPVAAIAGSIMIGHSALDRILGYGLKYSDSFRHTHLGNF